MTIGKTTAWTRQTFVGKVMSLLFIVYYKIMNVVSAYTVGPCWLSILYIVVYEFPRAIHLMFALLQRGKKLLPLRTELKVCKSLL